MSEENKIYLVECSSGSWDDYHSWVGGIFKTKEAAEMARDILNEKSKEVKDRCPVKTKFEDMTDEEENIYWKYKIENKEMDWNESVVKDYLLDKIYNDPRNI